MLNGDAAKQPTHLAFLWLISLFAHRIAQHEAENSMSVQNLAIVFGPTLFSQAQPGMNGHMNGMADASLQNKVRSWLYIPPRSHVPRPD